MPHNVVETSTRILVVVTSYQSKCQPLRRLAVFLCLLASSAAHADADLLPKPAEIEADVNFWKRVYTEIDTDHGFIHDDQHLDVVYETIELEPGIDRRRRNHQVEDIKQGYRTILLKLARGDRENLSEEEQRVLRLWPEDVSDRELREASHRLRFQLGQSDKFREGLVRSGRWLPHIKRLLQENDVPVELAALPHVESSFNPAAYSFIGAAGLWQFTASTGRRYMRVDHVVDERLDPFIATEAAAKLLKHNFVTTGTWPLAITAYNHGAAGMRRAVEQTGGTDIVKILRHYQSRSFKFASRNFYVAFLAAFEVQRDAEKYFGPIEREAEEVFTVVHTPGYIPAKKLADSLDVDMGVLQKINPALRPPVWRGEKHIPKDFNLRLPVETGGKATEVLAQLDTKLLEERQLPDVSYRVRPGDSLSMIADRFHVSETELMRMNNLRSRHFIRAGQELRLPQAVSGISQIKRELVNGTYSVQRGDTLSVIADSFGVSLEQLVRQNRLPDRHSLKVGQELIVAPLDEVAIAAVQQDEPQQKSEPATDLAVTLIEQQVSSIEEPAADEQAESITPDETAGAVPPDQPALTADPSNYLVDRDRNTVAVQAGETLGHFAEWLKLRAQDLRRINGLDYGQQLIVGGRLKLDFSRTTVDAFEAQRVAYHRNVQETYFAQYQINGVEERQIRRGDLIWDLIHSVYRVPLWLFMQYNPDVDLKRIKPGDKVFFPRVELKASG